MSALKTLQQYERSSSNSSTRQYRTNGYSNGGPVREQSTPIGDLYFHHIFQRDAINHAKRPILTQIFEHDKPNQLLLLDGENCMNRLFGGGFQEWWTSGVYKETVDMLQNLEYYAFTKKCFIVIAFAGRLPDPTEEKIAPIRKREFLSKHYELALKGRKALDKTQHSREAFTQPVAMRDFLRRYDLQNLKIVSTPGDHVASVIKWVVIC